MDFEALSVVVMALLFILVVLRFAVFASPPPYKRPSVIVLGSGGHTSEMFNFLRTIPVEELKRFSPRHYIAATTDTGSYAFVKEFEESVGSKRGEVFFHKIPRAREVGQSYMSSVFTTLYAFFYSIFLVFKVCPLMVFANGPGTCVPVVAASWILTKLGVTHYNLIVYSESYACVSRPSLTTKLIASNVDLLFVQWEKLLRRYKHAILVGRIPKRSLHRHVQRKDEEDSDSDSEKAGAVKKVKSYVLVTVGSTKFDALIAAVDSVAFGELIASLGYSGIHIQYGKGRKPTTISQTDSLPFKFFDFVPSLRDEIANASLVIGHAGVATIFETLEADTDLVVVPNESLMNNHQREISEELSSRRYLIVSTLRQLRSTIAYADFSSLNVFPKKENQLWWRAIRGKIKAQSLGLLPTNQS